LGVDKEVGPWKLHEAIAFGERGRKWDPSESRTPDLSNEKVPADGQDPPVDKREISARDR